MFDLGDGDVFERCGGKTGLWMEKLWRDSRGRSGWIVFVCHGDGKSAEADDERDSGEHTRPVNMSNKSTSIWIGGLVDCPPSERRFERKRWMMMHDGGRPDHVPPPEAGLKIPKFKSVSLFTSYRQRYRTV